MSRYALEFGADGLYSHATTPLSRKNPDEYWTCQKSPGVPAEASRDREAAVVAHRGRGRRGVVARGGNRDRVATRRRRDELVLAAAVRRCGGGCINPVRVDQGHGGASHVRGRWSTGAYQAIDLVRRTSDGQGEEGRHAERQHEEYREGSDCPMTAWTHSGFCSLCRSTV